MKNDYLFTAGDGEKIPVTTYGDISAKNSKALFYIHGFKGFKDWGFVPYIGQFLSQRNLFVITFNFSHNGIGETMTEFTELEKFAANTFSREIRELSELIDAFHGGFFGNSDSKAVGLLGHSRGGADAILTATDRADVAAVTLWSSVSTLNRYSDDVKRKWRKDGSLNIVNQRTGQVMKLSTTLLDEIEKLGNNRLSIEKAVAGLKRPLLVIHGENDEAVPVSEGKQIFDWSDKSCSAFHPIPNTGHTFDAVHPFRGSNDNLDKALDLTSRFFQESL